MTKKRNKRRNNCQAHYQALLEAVERGDAATVATLVSADPPIEVKPEQATNVLKACSVAPNPTALLDALRRIPYWGGRVTRNTLLHACERGATPSTVEYIVKWFCQDKAVSRFDSRNGLVLATQSRNFPLVEYLLATFKNFEDYDELLLMATNTNDEEFALRCLSLQAVQTFVTSVEASFEPLYIAPTSVYEGNVQVGDSKQDVGVATTLRYLSHRPGIRWIAHAITHGMRQVVKWMAVHCPLAAGEATLCCGCTGQELGTTVGWELYQRHEGVNVQIRKFYDAIQVGDADLVCCQLAAEPALIRSKLDLDISAAMTSSVSPNPIALVEALRQHVKSHDLQPAQVFLHACENGGEVETVVYLWEWVNFTTTSRQSLVSKGLYGAIQSQNLPVVRFVLTVAPQLSTTMDAEQLALAAMETDNENFVLALLKLPQMTEFYKTMNSQGYGQRRNWFKDSCFVNDADYDEVNSHFQVPIASRWLQRAILYDMPRVAEYLAGWWPNVVRKDVFVHFYHHTWQNLGIWRELSQRYKWDVTWQNVKVAHLVQRRLLPGLDHVGWYIATALYLFNLSVEYNHATCKSRDQVESSSNYANDIYDNDDDSGKN
ncbi:hypothetical protein DYB28_003709 [Aphanomyces astaci]|uniref:Uncharacterized protein n=1 Tax=Aphanomyces astaci TaxID=112090 RepID=A0A9X8E4T3_APHAT|nr:hypothetical protein DYB28_003709 [Aphanomyces astaci]